MDASSWRSIARCSGLWSTRSMSKLMEGDMNGKFFHARTNRDWRLLLVLLAVASSCIVNDLVSAADQKVRIFSGTDEHWVQFQVAKTKGFFKDEGLDAEVTVFTTGATATEAFRAGRGDF